MKFFPSIIVFSIFGSALALSYPAVPRDDSDFTDEQLLGSCPGGPGTDGLKKADRCTLLDPVDNPDTRNFVVLGDPQLNCAGGSEDISVQLGGSQEVSETTTVSANVGINIEDIDIGGGVEQSSEKSTTVSKQITYQVPPGRQAVYAAGTLQKSQTGRVQMNYGSRQHGHFIWFTQGTITQITPVPDDVEFEVHETACGTDARDFNNNS